MVRKCLLGVLTLLLGAILPPTAAGGWGGLVVGASLLPVTMITDGDIRHSRIESLAS